MLRNNIYQPTFSKINEADFSGSQSGWFQINMIQIHIYNQVYQLALHFIVYLRVPQTSIIKLFIAVSIPTVAALFFQGLDGSQAGVRNRNGVLFFLSISVGFTAIQFMVLVFPQERPIFLKEYKNNMYSVSAYFFGRLISELPWGLLMPTIFGSVIYWWIGLNPLFERYLVYIGSLIVLYNTTGSLALIIAAAFKNSQTAVTVAPMFVIVSQLFAGFIQFDIGTLIVAIESIPAWLRWIQYLSFTKYVYTALMLNEYTGLELKCETDPFFPCDPLGDFNAKQNIQESLLALFGMYIGFTALAFLIMATFTVKSE